MNRAVSCPFSLFLRLICIGFLYLSVLFNELLGLTLLIYFAILHSISIFAAIESRKGESYGNVFQ